MVPITPVTRVRQEIKARVLPHEAQAILGRRDELQTVTVLGRVKSSEVVVYGQDGCTGKMCHLHLVRVHVEGEDAPRYIAAERLIYTSPT